MLKNNSDYMKTVVETFLIEETVDLLHDNDQLGKWNAIVEELGLQGQTEIVKVGKSPIPFLWLNTGMFNVFKTLCPREVDIEKFNIMPIPLEILSLAAMSKREGYFRKTKVWYDDAEKDPCVVGITEDFIPMDEGYHCYPDGKCNTPAEAIAYLESIGKKPYDKEGGRWQNQKYYLIGKRADVKHSFSELREMAQKRYISERKNKIDEDMKNLTRNLEDLQNESFRRFGNETIGDFPF